MNKQNENKKLALSELQDIASWLRTDMDKDGQSLRSPYKVGSAYFIRTVTHHYTGRLLQVWPRELVLEDAAWIADDGRFAEALRNVEFNEVEPYPKDAQVILNRESILDAVIIPISKLPRTTK